jgi:hypothetical protein
VWYRFKTRCKNKKGKRTERGTRVVVSILEIPPGLDYYNLRNISRREQTEETKYQKRAGFLSRLVQISEFERYVAETENNEDLQHQHSVKTQYRYYEKISGNKFFSSSCKTATASFTKCCAATSTSTT